MEEIFFDYAPTLTDANPASLKSLSTSDTTLSFTYDADLVTSVDLGGPVSGTVLWSYNNNFPLAQEDIAAAGWTAWPVAYDYDDDGLLTGAGTMTLVPRPDNGLLQSTSLGVVASSRGYDGFGGIATETWTKSGAALYENEYEYDGLGRIEAITETVQGVTKTTAYEYDASGRLWQVTENGSVVSRYGYDDNGNRTQLDNYRTNPVSIALGLPDGQDRLQTWNGATYTYTANGELESKTKANQVTDYEYDVFGNLTRADLPGGASVSYLNDALGRRVAKYRNSALTPEQGFLWGGRLQPIAELEANGQVVSRFVYATRINVPDYMVSRRDSNGVVGPTWYTYRIVTNHLGSPRLVVNVETGIVAQTMTYDEFGNVLADNRPGFQPFGFAGGLYDQDTKLVRFGARDYDPETGRWTAKDPIRFAGGDANLYGYVANDPVNWIDPEGESKFDKFHGVPKKFWNWYHRQGKKDGDSDLGPDEAKDLFDEWNRLGKPGPDSKGPKRSGWDDLFDLIDFIVPFPPILDPCLVAPSLCNHGDQDYSNPCNQG